MDVEFVNADVVDVDDGEVKSCARDGFFNIPVKVLI